MRPPLILDSKDSGVGGKCPAPRVPSPPGGFGNSFQIWAEPRREGKIGNSPFLPFLGGFGIRKHLRRGRGAGREGKGREKKRARGDWRVWQRSVKAGDVPFEQVEALCSISDFGICACLVVDLASRFQFSFSVSIFFLLR